MESNNGKSKQNLVVQDPSQPQVTSHDGRISGFYTAFIVSMHYKLDTLRHLPFTYILATVEVGAYPTSSGSGIV